MEFEVTFHFHDGSPPRINHVSGYSGLGQLLEQVPDKLGKSMTINIQTLPAQPNQLFPYPEFKESTNA